MMVRPGGPAILAADICWEVKSTKVLNIFFDPPNRPAAPCSRGL